MPPDPLENLEIDITLSAGDWPDLAVMNDLVRRALLAVAEKTKLIKPGAQYDLSIVLTDNAEIQILNKNYRGKDRPTNVLSFPMDDDGDEAGAFCPPGAVMLGDIIFACETIATEAADQNKSFDEHFQHLLIHGFLHLHGYDHETDPEAREMEQLEIEILAGLGINNPYEIRDSVP